MKIPQLTSCILTSDETDDELTLALETLLQNAKEQFQY